jgi:diguanylate cyclase (GGDEF)-like protein
MFSNFKTRLSAAFVVVLAAMLAVAVLSFKNTHNLISASLWVAHTNEVIAAIEATRDSFSGAEAVQSPPGNSSPVATQYFRENIERLRQLTQDNPRQQEHIRQIETELLSHPSDPDTRQALKQTLHQMKADERRLLSERIAVSGQATKSTIRMMRVFAAIVLLTFVLSYWGLFKNLCAQERTQQALAQSETRLKALLANEQELSRVDPLTMVPNRRGFYESLEKERVRTVRYHRPVTLGYIDVDNFKKMNDTYGHTMGDDLLIAVAATVRTNLRTSDVVARLGGDEFAVLLPETDAIGSDQVLKKLRLKLLDAMQERGWNVTFSIGAVTFLDPPESLDILVRMADETMYAIKARGKDDVSVCLMG